MAFQKNRKTFSDVPVFLALRTFDASIVGLFSRDSNNTTNSSKLRTLQIAAMVIYLRSGTVSIELQAVSMLAQSSVGDYIVSYAGASVD